MCAVLRLFGCHAYNVVPIFIYTILVAFSHTLHHEAAIWQYGTVDILFFQGKDQQINLTPGLHHRPCNSKFFQKAMLMQSGVRSQWGPLSWVTCKAQS